MAPLIRTSLETKELYSPYLVHESRTHAHSLRMRSSSMTAGIAHFFTGSLKPQRAAVMPPLRPSALCVTSSCQRHVCECEPQGVRRRRDCM
ncbi:hypothetical protein KC331_g47 [Hortaea werneckii]|nr:hypothetical protein KC331_g47 [Hortaea werneckii]